MNFPAAHGRSAVKGRLAVLAVTLGIFSLMTSELLPVGLLTPIGTALDVSGGTAGLMVTVPGLVAAVSAPLVTVATGRTDRRIVLVVLIGLMGPCAWYRPGMPAGPPPSSSAVATRAGGRPQL